VAKDRPSKIAEQFDKYAVRPDELIFQMDDGLKTSINADVEYFLAERFARRVQAETEWFEEVISHDPTVGAFYEILLRNALKELAPIACEIGTGFVLDPHRAVHSKQLDILTYNCASSAPVFKSGDLVVVRPSSVMSVAEIKKTLDYGGLRETMDGTFFSNLGTHTRGSYEGIQNVNIFGFDSKIDLRRYATTLKKYLDNALTYTKLSYKPSHVGPVVLENLVLPNIFIRKNHFYIRCRLHVEEDPGEFRIQIDVHKSQEENGCIGAFMLSMLPIEKSFISPQLEMVEDSIWTSNKINLSTVISMNDLARHFTQDYKEIVQFRVDGNQPYQVIVPKSLSWRKWSRFGEFVAAVGLRSFVSAERILPVTE
jgi:hypothetical protein